MNIHRTSKDLQPDYYVDKLAVWFKAKPSAAQLAELERLCPSLYDRNGSEEPMRCNPQWIYYVKATQPSLAYMESLAKIAETIPILINCVELARDECCNNRHDLEDLYEFRCNHEIRLWHSKTQTLHRYEDSSGNTYDARRTRARVMTRYKEPGSRSTKGTHCLHTEIRLNGSQSVERAGIYEVRDLINFDHVAWWATRTRILTAPDTERLGRYLRNKYYRTRRQSAQFDTWRHGLKVNLDAYRGKVCWIASKWCVQGLVDLCGGISRLVQLGVIEPASSTPRATTTRQQL
jgi:hypothetical protein